MLRIADSTRVLAVLVGLASGVVTAALLTELFEDAVVLRVLAIFALVGGIVALIILVPALIVLPEDRERDEPSAHDL